MFCFNILESRSPATTSPEKAPNSRQPSYNSGPNGYSRNGLST